jgi:hypothetical protein
MPGTRHSSILLRYFKENQRLPIFKKSFDEMAGKARGLRILSNVLLFPSIQRRGKILDAAICGRRQNRFLFPSSCHDSRESRKIAIARGTKVSQFCRMIRRQTIG